MIINNMKLKYYAILALSFLSSSLVFAQNVTISGKVADNDGLPIIGANVVLLSSSKGVATDVDGNFSIEGLQSGKCFMQISAIGYQTVTNELNLTEQNTKLSFVLKTVSTDLDEVLVTANRRLQNIQKTAASVSAVTTKKIQQLQINKITELNSIAPNFQTYDDGGSGAFALTASRGISTIDTENPIIGIYIDGAPYFSNFALPLDLNNIQQIEILRGPQGTLYGRNSLAGIIKITSKKPVNDLSGFADIGAGNLNSKRLAFGVSVPIIKDKLFLGIDGVTSTRGGYILNEFNNKKVHDQNVLGTNVKLKYLASEQFALNFNYGYQERESDAYALIAPTPDNNLQDIIKDNSYKVNLDTDINRKASTHNLNTNLVYDFNKFSLNFNTTYQITDQNRLDDFDFSPSNIQSSNTDYKFNNLAQEIRLVSTNNSDLEWVAGIFAFHNKQDRLDDKRNGVDSGKAGAPFSTFEDIELVQKGIAAYSQFSYHLDKFAVTGGLRYDFESTSVKVSRTLSNSSAPAQTFSEQADFNAISPKITLSYQANDNVFLFTSLAKGYRPGGVNQFVADLSVAPYDPEKTLNYELGLKTNLFDNKMKLNLTGFYTSYTDQQIFTVLNLSNFDFGLDNIGKSRVYGIELESKFFAAKGLHFDMNLGYLNTKVLEYETFDFKKKTFVDASGGDLPLSPVFNGMIGAYYAVPVSKKLNFETNISYIYQSDMYFDLPEDLLQESYGLLNSRIGITSKNIDFFIWGKNITDEAYYSYGFGISGFNAASFALPRTYGATLTAKF